MSNFELQKKFGLGYSEIRYSIIKSQKKLMQWFKLNGIDDEYALEGLITYQGDDLLDQRVKVNRWSQRQQSKDSFEKDKLDELERS